jgi:hypothetical protein
MNKISDKKKKVTVYLTQEDETKLKMASHQLSIKSLENGYSSISISETIMQGIYLLIKSLNKRKKVKV